MGEPHKYGVVSMVAWLARGIGWVLIVLAVINLPQLRNLTGNLAIGIGLFSSFALAVAGIVWLGAVEAVVYVFNRYLSRN